MHKTWTRTEKLTFNNVISFPYSRLILRLNSLFRTGKVENNFSTVTVVPTWRAVFFWDASSPEWLNVKWVPTVSSFVLVSMVKFPNAAKELNASPLKPNVDRDWRSVKSAILEVWCLSARDWNSGKTHKTQSKASKVSYKWKKLSLN